MKEGRLGRVEMCRWCSGGKPNAAGSYFNVGFWLGFTSNVGVLNR